MNHKIKNYLVLSLLALSFGMSSISSEAVWIWEPKTGRWYNPKFEVKGSAKAQFQNAESFEKKREWERAAKEFKKLVKAYPTSPLAAQALVRSAENYKKSNFYYEAFQAYQMLVEKYPSYPDIQKVVNEEYRIGNLFLSGKKRKMKFIKLALFPSMNIAVEIFQKVIENFPFGDLADQAQLKLGIANQKMDKFPEAVEAYKKLLKEYPKSTIRDEAKYRIGFCFYKQSKNAAYDQAATEKALETFNEFVREYPESKRFAEVKNKIKELNARKAQGLFESAAYYHKVGDLASAKVYYAQVIELFPDSEQAKLAKIKMDTLAKKAQSSKGAQ